MRLALIALAVAVQSAPAAAQTAARPSPSDAVLATVVDLFDGMRAADSSAVRAQFHPDARLLTVASDPDGGVALRETPIDRFVAAMPGDHPTYDERLGDATVQIDGDLATVWVPYAFYLGDAFSHCGTNAFQLVRTDGAWRIFHIADTRRPDGCDPSIGE